MDKPKTYAIGFLMVFFFACHGEAPAPIVSVTIDRNIARPQESGQTPIADRNLCDQVSQIKVLPFKGEKGKDTAYDSLITAGDSVVPCLIDKIADTSPMPDPRETPKFADTRVGDIAYFVFTDITKIDFVAPLPPEVRRDYEDDGVYAYFRFVEKPENRKKLQQASRDLFKNTHAASQKIQ
jgi:hypothetical protein